MTQKNLPVATLYKWLEETEGNSWSQAYGELCKLFFGKTILADIKTWLFRTVGTRTMKSNGKICYLDPFSEKYVPFEKGAYFKWYVHPDTGALHSVDSLVAKDMGKRHDVRNRYVSIAQGRAYAKFEGKWHEVRLLADSGVFTGADAFLKEEMKRRNYSNTIESIKRLRKEFYGDEFLRVDSTRAILPEEAVSLGLEKNHG